MKTVNVEILLPKILPMLPGCNDTIAKIALSDAARTFARETDIIVETRGFVDGEAPEYGRMPEFALDPENFLPHHFIARNVDKSTRRVYITYSLLPTGNLMPESVVNRYYEAITNQALFTLCAMPNKPWSAPDMVQIYLQKYQVAAGDAIRDNTTGGAVFDQFMICGDVGDVGYLGAMEINATVIGTDTSDGSVTPGQMLLGAVAYAKGEKVIGNIQSVTASLNKNIFTVPIGYVGSPVMLSIPEVTATLNKNTVTVPVGYIGEEQKLTVPVSNITNNGETVTVPVGYVEREQSFRIDGRIDLSFVTATSGDILAGKVGADENGNPVTGTIQTVKASLSENVVNVPKGYIAEAQTLTVAEMAEPSVSGNVVTIPVGYNKTQKTKTIPEAGELSVSGNTVTCPVGYVKSVRTATVPEAGETTVSGNVVTTPAGYVKAERKTIVGTLRESTTITPGTSWKNIPAGTYLAGDQYIAGDENLIPENIADGVSIFNVQGTHKGGSSMDFYKCASVDTENKTWTGYKAIIDDEGVWSFEETVSTGLLYDRITPQKNYVYDADCTFRVSQFKQGLPVPASSLIAYLPLKSDFDDVMGNYKIEVSTGTFEERFGRPSMKATGGTYAEWRSSLPNTTGALSIFCAVSGIGYSGWGGIMAVGEGISSMFGLDNYRKGMNGRIGYDWGQFGELSTTKWDTIAMTRDDAGNYKMYLNGEEIAQTTQDSITNVTMGYLTAGYCREAHMGNIYISDCCVYSRALSADEIAAMHMDILIV
jgi:hypothetical protein